MASQTGHAFVDTIDECKNKDPTRYEAYSGTKIVIAARDEEQLRLAHIQAQQAGLPCVLITDSGHIMPPHFDGSPIVTALGIGPARRDEINHITRKFQLVK